MKKISKDLSSLFWTQFFGALNDNVFKNALVILITYQSISLFGLNPGSMVALAGGIFILPFFLFSATAGQLADNYEKTALVKIIKQAEVVISLLAIIGLFQKNYTLLLIVLFLLGIHSTFFGPLKYSLIPEYASKDHLVFANALVSSGTFVAILLGTFLGGLSANDHNNLFGLKFLLIFFALSGLYFASRLKRVAAKENTGKSVSLNPLSSSKEILKLLFKNNLVKVLCFGLSWFWFLGAGLLSLIPLVAKNVFFGNEQVAALMLFTFTLGMGIGPFVLERITRGKVIRFLIPLSLIIMSFFIFDIALTIKALARQSAFLQISTSLHGEIGIREFFELKMSYRILFDLFSLAFFGGVFTVPQFAELQRIVANYELSRIVAGNNILNAAAMVLVSLLIMLLHLKQFSIANIFGIIGVLNIFAGLIFIFYYRNEFNKFWRF